MFAAKMFEVPWTTRLVKVPTLVIFVWAAAVTDKAVPTVETLEPFTFDIPEALEAMSKPETVSPVSVPTDVIFVCAATVTL